MSKLADKLALIKPAKVMARGVAANLKDFEATDTASTQQAKEMLLRLERTFHSWFCLAIADDSILPPAPEGVTKLDLIVAAAESTATVLENLVDALPLDVAAADPAVLGVNTLAWGTFKDHYVWLVQSLPDDVYWTPAPAGLTAPTTPGGATATPLTPKALADGLTALLADETIAGPLLAALKAKFLGG